MRSEPTINIRCDGKDCYAVLVAVGKEDIEDRMEEAGWSVGWNTKDYCPACQVSDPEEGE